MSLLEQTKGAFPAKGPRTLDGALSRVRHHPTSLAQKTVAVFLLAVIVVGLNFHLFFLQLYGWGTMVLEHRESTESWSEAAERTLSGETPCNVCVQVETALWANPPSLESLTAEEIPYQPIFFCLLPGSKSILPFPPTASEPIALPVTTPVVLTSTPPAPPPRPLMV